MNKPVMKRVEHEVNIDGDYVSLVFEKAKLFAEKSGVDIKDVIFDIDSYDDYGSPTTEIKFVCYRPETLQERHEREALEAERLAIQKRYDDSMLDALKKKYPEKFK